MRIVEQIWWLLGALMAVPFVVPGVGKLTGGDVPMGLVFVGLGFAVLFLPEYVRWQLMGGNSPFNRVPFITSRAERGQD